jgi:DNA uptake protein ComE-like DNA-binding protein
VIPLSVLDLSPIVAGSSAAEALRNTLDLNTATDSAFMTIPGVGKKMAYEFQEYRPWKSIEQFRREIGKYVDKNEVARLEQYVSIPGK